VIVIVHVVVVGDVSGDVDESICPFREKWSQSSRDRHVVQSSYPSNDDEIHTSIRCPRPPHSPTEPPRASNATTFGRSQYTRFASLS